MVSHPNRLFQCSTTMSLIDKMKNRFREQGRTGNKTGNPAMKSGLSCYREKQDRLQNNPAFFTGYLLVPCSALLGRCVCTLSSDFFQVGEKWFLQTWNFFLAGDPEKKVGLYYKPTFFQVGEKWLLQTWIFFSGWRSRKKFEFAEPLFCHPQNHF